MKKEDVEKIMDLSFLLGRKKYARGVSLVDIYDLSCKVWEEIKEEPKEKKTKYYLLNKFKLEQLQSKGEIYITEDDENEIVLLYQDYALRLESGDVLGCWNLLESDDETMENFFEDINEE